MRSSRVIGGLGIVAASYSGSRSPRRRRKRRSPRSAWHGRPPPPGKVRRGPLRQASGLASLPPRRGRHPLHPRRPRPARLAGTRRGHRLNTPSRWAIKPGGTRAGALPPDRRSRRTARPLLRLPRPSVCTASASHLVHCRTRRATRRPPAWSSPSTGFTPPASTRTRPTSRAGRARRDHPDRLLQQRHHAAEPGCRFERRIEGRSTPTGTSAWVHPGRRASRTPTSRRAAALGAASGTRALRPGRVGRHAAGRGQADHSGRASISRPPAP